MLQKGDDKSTNVSSVSMSKRWWARLDAIVSAAKVQNYRVTRSSLFVGALEAFHTQLSKYEKQLGLPVTKLSDLKDN